MTSTDLSCDLGDAADQPRRLAACTRHYNADWERVRSRAAPARWTAHQSLAGCRALDDVLACIGGDRSVPMAQADAALGLVVRLAADDELAARVVLQRILPGLVAVARRRARWSSAPTVTVLVDLVAQAWIGIRTYPSHRRPTKVAANLVRDAEYHLYTRPARLRSAGEEPSGRIADDRLTVDAAGRRDGELAPADEVRVTLAGARVCGVAAADVELLGRLVLDGVSPEQLGSELAVTSRTIRSRRRAAVAAVAAVAAA
jgi:hypothetical protein